MFRIYKDSISTPNDISHVVHAISPFRYAINPDYTFELPSLTFQTSLADMPYDTNIYIVRTANTAQRIHFYVKSAKYSYETGQYTVECEHVFLRLKAIYARSIPVVSYQEGFAAAFPEAWLETPLTAYNGYENYNWQLASSIQQNVYFQRRYYQALFLLKMLIRRASGVNVADVNDTAFAAVEFYQSTAYGALANSRICLAAESVLKAGSAKHNDVSSTDYDVYSRLPSAFDILQQTCALLRCYIDVFSSTYTIGALDQLSIPSGIITYRSDETVEPTRTYSLSQRNLALQASPRFDYAYSYWDTGSETEKFYTWGSGVTSPDITLEDNTIRDVDEDVLNSRAVNIRFSDLIRAYLRVDVVANAYQKHIVPIAHSTHGSDRDQLIAAILAYHQGCDTRVRLSVSGVDGLAMHGEAVEYDIAQSRLTTYMEGRI